MKNILKNTTMCAILVGNAVKICYNDIMKYQIDQNMIRLHCSPEFNIKDICHCGQVFRYFDKEAYTDIIANNEWARIFFGNNSETLIECSNPQYFVNYFDLDSDYSKIKDTLLKYNFPKDAIKFGEGIRILKQDFFEVFVSFIVSQNNNIARIQKSLNQMASDWGTRIGNNHFAFPTLSQLQNANEQYFVKIGLGYRAKYMIQFLSNYSQSLESDLQMLDTEHARQKLLSFLGVGPKVADCILLFGLHRLDVFPVDTWINKVAIQFFGMENLNRKQIANQLVKKFGQLSGYAQQYLFYYKRENAKKSGEII